MVVGEERSRWVGRGNYRSAKRWVEACSYWVRGKWVRSTWKDNKVLCRSLDQAQGGFHDTHMPCDAFLLHPCMHFTPQSLLVSSGPDVQWGSGCLRC